MYDIVCAGIATWDTLFSGIPEELMDIDGVTAKGYVSASGGDAVNAGISLARLGCKTAVMGCVGNDSFAQRIEADLKAAGADSYLYKGSQINTAAPVILIDETGERHLVRVPGNGNTQFCREMMDDTVLFHTRHLHIASVNMLPKLDGAPLAKLFQQAHEHGITTSMDASGDKSGQWFAKIKDVIPHCDIFIPSFQEARMYAGSDNLKEITHFFSQFHLKYFGIKLGAKGVYVTDFKEEYTLPSLYEGIPVDTTGAGDSFFAGFLAGYLKGYNLRSCALIGSAQAALVMRSYGANVSAGNWNDVTSLITQKGEIITK
ncbi:MAG: carbohydrate kinase family protein [Lactimicrobium sp.]|jgi:sugar/nucleoside kinase (ribokinase family)|uniref:carbohydrate kinase family protein n=1 Tax=Lactimicrobium sp. TaxID=2563780 RepID=UPI002F353106